MHLDETRRQTFEVNFSQFIANLVHLVNANSSSNLQRIERAEVSANSLKTLRLLTDDLQIATRINHNQPNLLAKLTPLIFEYQDYQFSAIEAKGLIYNMRQVIEDFLPDEL